VGNDGISGEQIGLSPARPARELNAARREHNVLVRIDGANHQVVFVDVDGDEAEPGLKWRVSHGILLVSGERRGAFFLG